MNKNDLAKRISKILFEINPEKFKEQYNYFKQYDLIIHDNEANFQRTSLTGPKNSILASYYVTPMVSYCGGYNIGGFSSGYSLMRKHLSTVMFLTEFFNLTSNKKGLILMTNNSTSKHWCSYVRDLLKKIPGVIVEVKDIINPNTNNEIQFTIVDAKDFCYRWISERLKTPPGNSELNYEFVEKCIKHVFTKPAEVVQPTVADKSETTPTVRTSKVRKNNGPCRTI